MTANGWLQILLFSSVILLVTKPMGVYIARVYDGSMRWLAPLERAIYRVCGVDPEEDQHWTRYAAALLLFSAVAMLVTYIALRLQNHLPLNPFHRDAVVGRQAFETAASFTTNTNWQSYSGETTMSYLSQMMQLGFQNFVSAATGVAAAAALPPSKARRLSARQLAHISPCPSAAAARPCPASSGRAVGRPSAPRPRACGCRPC